MREGSIIEMKLILYLLFITLFINFSYAQYSRNDKELVRSVYERKISKEEIAGYLYSGDPVKVNAALLAISNTADTSFISDITRLDFLKSSEYICFALGQLGRSDTSEAYLTKQLNLHPALSRYILPALSRTSRELYIVSFTEGSSLSLYNYSQRKIGVTSELAGFLLKELQNRNDFFSAFALYRIGPPEGSKEVLTSALKKAFNNKDRRSIPYLLGCFRKLKIFPERQELYNKILSLKEFDAKIEAVKVLASYKHGDKSLRDYFAFFNDKNGNITRQAAISIADIQGVSAPVLTFIEKMILCSSFDEVTREELLLSYLKLSGISFSDLRNKFNEKISERGFIHAAQLKGDKESGDYLQSIYDKSNFRNKVLILSYQDSSSITSVIEHLKKSDPGITELLNDSIKFPLGNFDVLWENAFKYRAALITTSKGNIKIKLHPEYAPVSAGNFCYLASKGYFNSNVFHRVVPGFVIQTGDTTGTGWSGPGYIIKSEFSPLEYKKGVVGMASSGKDTEGSQWFITTGNYPHLDGRYSVFAEVIDGQSKADETLQEDRIISVELIQ